MKRSWECRLCGELWTTLDPEKAPDVIICGKCSEKKVWIRCDICKRHTYSTINISPERRVRVCWNCRGVTELANPFMDERVI